MKDFGVTFFNQYRFERQDLIAKFVNEQGSAKNWNLKFVHPEMLLNL